MHRLKSMFFYQLTLLPNNIVLTSYLSGFYLEPWFSGLCEGVQKTLKKRRKQTEGKLEKWSERKMEKTRKIKQQQYTSLVLNYILLENIAWKKLFYTIKFYLQFLWVAGYLKHSNNTPYTNYNMIEIYI